MTCPDVMQAAGPSSSFVCEKHVSHIRDGLMCNCSHTLYKYCLFGSVCESQSGWQSCLRTESTLDRPLAFFPAARWLKTLKATVNVLKSAAFTQFRAGSRDLGERKFLDSAVADYYRAVSQMQDFVWIKLFFFQQLFKF